MTPQCGVLTGSITQCTETTIIEGNQLTTEDMEGEMKRDVCASLPVTGQRAAPRRHCRTEDGQEASVAMKQRPQRQQKKQQEVQEEHSGRRRGAERESAKQQAEQVPCSTSC